MVSCSPVLAFKLDIHTNMGCFEYTFTAVHSYAWNLPGMQGSTQFLFNLVLTQLVPCLMYFVFCNDMNTFKLFSGIRIFIRSADFKLLVL